jgi:arabinoxylan arabinofuranohydrolase
LQVYGPGHQSIVDLRGQHYILYHKHRLPFVPGNAFRQICMNPLHFEDNGLQIKNIIPENTVEIPVLSKAKRKIVTPTELVASSFKDQHSGPGNVSDQHYGTLWESSSGDDKPILTAKFNNAQQIENVEVRFEYASTLYFFRAEITTDGQNWIQIAEYSETGIEGSPVILKVDQKIEGFRLIFSKRDASPALWELVFLQ